jgi:hypothetical protein
MTFLLAAACGLIAVNLYSAKLLAGPISAALGLSPQATGLIVTLVQIGYRLWHQANLHESATVEVLLHHPLWQVAPADTALSSICLYPRSASRHVRGLTTAKSAVLVSCERSLRTS